METAADNAQKRIIHPRSCIASGKRRPEKFLPRIMEKWEDEIASLLLIANPLPALPKPETSAAPGKEDGKVAELSGSRWVFKSALMKKYFGNEFPLPPTRPSMSPLQQTPATAPATTNKRETTAGPANPLPAADVRHPTRSVVCHSTAQLPEKVPVNEATKPNSSVPSPAAKQKMCFACRSAYHYIADCPTSSLTVGGTRARDSFCEDHGLDPNCAVSWLLYEAFLKAEAANGDIGDEWDEWGEWDLDGCFPARSQF